MSVMLMLALAVSDRLIDSAADLRTCSVIVLLGSQHSVHSVCF